MLYWDCEEGAKCYIKEVLPNWDVFNNECFIPTNIKMSDIDGVVERKGHFLFFEVKQNTKTIQVGQRILFENLTRDAPHISVILLYAQNVSENMDIQEYAVFKEGKMSQNWTPTSTEEMQKFVRSWFQRVDQLQ